MNKLLLASVLFLFSLTTCLAQELISTVKVLDNQIQLTNKKIFRTLEQTLTEYLNTTKWTEENIAPEERIECNFQIVLSSYNVSTNNFQGTLQVQSTRPIYGTSYNSVVFNFLDENINFDYAEFQRMNFNQNAFTDNITSLFAFYAYYVIGLDFDSFGKMGGTPYFQKALQIANNAQPSGLAGWQPFERNLRSRYNLIDNILNERFSPVREAYYLYHRKGLDVMSKTPEIGRKAIFESLLQMQKIFKIAPNTVMIIMFFEAKCDELVNIYKNAPAIEKPKAIELLSEINVSNISKYEKIR